MRSYSSIMTEIAHQSSILRQLNEEESSLLKIKLLKIYSDLADICRRYNLDMMLVGGSALGSVRHKGFIPWDDDIDVALSRTDYEKLIEIIEKGELGNEYEYTYPNPKSDSKNLFLKIYLKNTINAEISDLYTPFPKGIFVDVFPIESAYRPGFRNRMKSFFSHILTFVSSSVLINNYPSPEFTRFITQTREGKKRYFLMKTIGFLCSVISHKKWVNISDMFLRSKRYTGYVTIPTGRKGYSGETVRYDVIFPTKEADFEGMKVKIPRDSHAYLENLYGDYMDVPPENKRERHLIADFKL